MLVGEDISRGAGDVKAEEDVVSVRTELLCVPVAREMGGVTVYMLGLGCAGWIRMIRLLLEEIVSGHK